MLYQGIAARAFERVFQLADYVQVKGAALENGLLHVDLVREIPEAKKPRQIPIGNSAQGGRGQSCLRHRQRSVRSIDKRERPGFRGAFIFANCYSSIAMADGAVFSALALGPVLAGAGVAVAGVAAGAAAAIGAAEAEGAATAASFGRERGSGGGGGWQPCGPVASGEWQELPGVAVQSPVVVDSQTAGLRCAKPGHCCRAPPARAGCSRAGQTRRDPWGRRQRPSRCGPFWHRPQPGLPVLLG